LFNLFHLNIRGIKHNLHLFNNYFVNYYPDILIFSESWSTPIDVNLDVLDNYTLISYYYRTNSIRGGVSIHYKSDLQLINFKQFEISCCVENFFEACCCYLKVGKKKIIVVLGTYKSPSSNTYAVLTQLDLCLSELNSKFGYDSIYFIGGDLNIDFLIESKGTKQLFDTLESYGFTLNYKDPNRKYGNCSSGIDYLVCNNPCSQYHASVFQSNISDHFHQILSIPKTSIGLCPAQTTGKSLKRIFSENTILNFKSAFNFCNDNIGKESYLYWKTRKRMMAK
jgi:hypothetical protein